MQPVASLNLDQPVDFCLLARSICRILQKIQRCCVDGNVQVHVEMILAINTTMHVPTTQNRFPANFDLLAIMSPSVQPNDKRTPVLSAADIMDSFGAGEGVSSNRIAACKRPGIGDLGINDIEGERCDFGAQRPRGSEHQGNQNRK